LNLTADTITMITHVDISLHLQCPICKNLLADPVSTTCGHTFCKDCLDRHICRSDSQCPLCQEPVTTKPSKMDWFWNNFHISKYTCQIV
uniref:RING-type domain-containing protein n=1 Tax=Cyprinus carpio TaxID=7962 RepID=A0A8C1WWU5_CYPCA